MLISVGGLNIVSSTVPAMVRVYLYNYIVMT